MRSFSPVTTSRFPFGVLTASKSDRDYPYIDRQKKQREQLANSILGKNRTARRASAPSAGVQKSQAAKPGSLASRIGVPKVRPINPYPHSPPDIQISIPLTRVRGSLALRLDCQPPWQQAQSPGNRCPGASKEKQASTQCRATTECPRIRIWSGDNPRPQRWPVNQGRIRPLRRGRQQLCARHHSSRYPVCPGAHVGSHAQLPRYFAQPDRHRRIRV
jgi:hypothetical protein